MVNDSQPPINALSVDVEDYFQVEAFSGIIPRQDWRRIEPRIESNTTRLLDLFDQKGLKATFFILGWVAEHHQRLIRKISDSGHEIACHGYDHRLITSQTPETFRVDLRRARKILEDITGEEVVGYRAPTYSINAKTLWALDILIEEGFRYDSSIFPIHHDRYGMPGAERSLHVIRREAGQIIEFPPSTIRMAGQNLPVAGGGYFRLLPYSLFRWCLKRINSTEGMPAMFMVHAWEVDPDQPVICGGRFNVWRHRVNLDRTMSRLSQLLDDFRFAPVREVLYLNEHEVTAIEPQMIGSTAAYARMD